MIKITPRKLLPIVLLAFSYTAFTFEPVPTKTLLLAYLENDLELQNLTLAAQKAELSLEYTKVSNGFDITLNSGNVVLTLNDDGSKLTASPSLEVEVPQASGLTLTAETDLTYKSETSAFSNSSLSAQLDLISTGTLSRKVTLLKSERALTQARRNLQNRAHEAENAFYTELKSLLSSIKTLIKAEQTLYSDTIDFESVKATGYSETSSTYRLAQMKVLSDKHSVESSLRALIHDYIVFYKKCGYDISLSPDQNYLELIPQDISQELKDIKPVNVLEFKKEDFAKIEEAVWNNQINTLERKTDSSFSLSAGAGYTIDNSSTNSDTVDALLSAGYGGLELAAGLSLPVGLENGSSAAPALTMAFSLSPTTFKKDSLQKKQASLTELQELIDIQSAEQDYETYIVTSAQNLESILWEKSNAQENYNMYSKLASDLEAWYNQGIISQSEYMSAQTNAAMYQVEIMMNMLDIVIYNDEVQTVFIKNNALPLR